MKVEYEFMLHAEYFGHFVKPLSIWMISYMTQ